MSLLKLNTGATIPQIALGTWQSFKNQAYDATLHALKSGYRHIDTAAVYLNEREVGKAIKDSGIPREDIFVTTKLWGTQQRNPLEALNQSLERLGLDYVDLYLVHWPLAFKYNESISVEENLQQSKEEDKDWDFIKTWQLVQELPATGKVKAIGVSNFSIKNLEELINHPTTKIVPAANQVELHPLLPQTELIEYGNKHGIVTEAYSPLGASDSPYWKNPVLLEIAKKYDVSVAQVLINWGVKRGYVVLPKSSNPDRISANLKVFELEEEDFNKVSDLYKTEGEHRLTHPKWGDFPLFE